MVTTTDHYPTDRHGWAEFLPERPTHQPLFGSHRVPWVVVGAGVTGLACARRLAAIHPEKDIYLLDARLVGQGTSGRNSGFAVAVSHFGGGFDSGQLETYRRINRINQTGLSLLRKQVFENSIGCQWHDGGFHHVAADQQSGQECDNFLRYLHELNIEHTPLNRDELIERLGTNHYQVGVHVPNGALMQPAALVHGLADNLPKNVRLFEQTPVLEIDSESPLTLKLENGEIRTDKLLMATNYEVSKLGFLNRYLIGSTLSGSFTRVLREQELASLGSLREWGVLSLHSGGATVRLTADHRLCLRNTAEYRGGALLTERQMARRQAIHRLGFERRFPELANVPFEYAWSGVEGISRNSTNFFGRQRDNIYFAGGYNGSGISRGTAFGTALAEYASGGQSDLVEDCLASLTASWIPPRPLLDVGAYLTVRSRFKGVGLDR